MKKYVLQKKVIDKIIYYLSVTFLLFSLPAMFIGRMIRKKKQLVCFYYVPEGKFNINRFEKICSILDLKTKIQFSMKKDQFDRWINFTNYFNYFFKNINLCLRGILRIIKYSNHNTFWIQRRFIAHYDFPSNIYEKIIKLLGIKIIMDYYDADILRNYKLYSELGQISNQITVTNQNLKSIYKGINNNILIIPLTINEKKYPSTKTYPKNKTIIGWMGSVQNSKGLEQHQNQLIKLQSKYPDISFQFICGEKPKLSNLKFEHFKFEEVSIKQWIEKITFGLSLYPNSNNSKENKYLKCKSPFKTMEYMYTKTAVISDKYGKYPGMIEFKHFLPIDQLNTEQFSRSFDEIINQKNKSKIILNSSNFYNSNMRIDTNSQINKLLI